jgi:hypothetical protein
MECDRIKGLVSVIPAHAGIQGRTAVLVILDARFRGHDGFGFGPAGPMLIEENRR